MADKTPPTSVEELLKGLWRDNPVFVMLLGMCPVLAVTNSVENALWMGAATTFVLFMSSTLVSILRKWIPKQVRIASFILIIATFVTVVEYLIQAISLDIHKALGAFISLIVVNCVILGRAEAFASRNGVGKSMLDALGMGLGFTFACTCLVLVRELLGTGAILGFPVFPESYEPWTVMILPGGAFFVLGGWLLLFNYMKERKRVKSA